MDYRTAVNPSYYTAQATLFMLAGAGNTNAQELRGGMSGHIKGFYTITDGDLMLEVNALKDAFCITFQVVNKDQTPLNLFCEALKQEGIPYSVSERFTRYIPKIKLPSCG